MSAGADLGWVRMADGGPADLRAAEALYVEAFPGEQRVPLDELLHEDRAGAAEVWLVHRDGRLAALAAVWPLPGSWRHLGYLAVDRAQRGGGVGAAVWRSLIGRLPPGGAMALEIEHPWTAGLDPVERQLRMRRLRFYTRLGARLMRAPGYAVPTTDRRGVIPMLLMAAPGRRAAMPAGELRALIGALHRTYGIPPDDPLTLRAQASAR